MSPRVPSYRLHKPTGQAVVTLGGGYGRDITASIEAHANVYRGLVRAFAA